MQALIKGNTALCVHQEQVSYQVAKGKKKVVDAHLYSAFLVLNGPAAGISGGLCEN